MITETLNALQDDIATTETLIDKAQTYYNTHKHLWTEEYAWYFQAEIDKARFDVEANKLLVNMLDNLQ